jgi:hypothetical protein
MLFKWFWRPSSESKVRWKDFICKKYQPSFENGLPTFIKSLSGIQQEIMSVINPEDDTSEALRRCSYYVIENGGKNVIF